MSHEDYADFLGKDAEEFGRAMEEYKRKNRRPFPTWKEVLEVAKSLGYRKVEPSGPVPGVPNPPHSHGEEQRGQ